MKWHFHRYPNVDPLGWSIRMGAFHLRYSGVDKYRTNGHRFAFGWNLYCINRHGFVAFL